MSYVAKRRYAGSSGLRTAPTPILTNGSPGFASA